MQRSLHELTEALNVYETRVSLALEASEMGIWDWYIDTDQLTLDQQALNVFGITKEEFLNTNNALSCRIHAADKEKVKECQEMAVKTGNKCCITFRYLSFNNEYVVITSKSRVVKDTDGKIVRMVGICYRELDWIKNFCPWFGTDKCSVKPSSL